MKSHEFMLTVEAGKRLIARGLLADAQFQRALYEKKVLIVAGTTNGYVAEAVLHALGAAGPLSLPAVSLPSAAPAAESDYTAAILARAQENLEAGCSSRLAELGLPCVVRMELACTGDTVEVKRITLCCETALSPEQVQQAEAIARSYGANAVVWADKAAEP